MLRSLSVLVFLACAGCRAADGPRAVDSHSQTAGASEDVPGITFPAVAVIPAPRELRLDPGSFAVSARTAVLAHETQSRRAAEYFVDLLKRTRGLALEIQPADSKTGAAIDFELSAAAAGADPGSYSLTVGPGGIVVSSPAASGLFYGAATLWQLLTPPTESISTASISVPAVSITDAPRFKWRGLMVDSARHYQSPEFIKKLIDVMALHKLNVLHWHLTDDQAWRLEIKQYPKLTAVGAWRVPAGPAAAADIDPQTSKPRRYGGFYSQEEVRDIVAFAASRHITIVPEIEMPGHASAAIAAYPELGVDSKVPQQVPADWGIYSNLFNVEEATFAFLKDVLSEVLELFPGEYIHVGGDEAVKEQWQASADVQAQMRKLGIKDEHALQSYFVQRIEKFLNEHQRRLIGWDEILEGGLAPNATVMSWRGVDGAIAAAAAGHDAVLAPAPTLYFDNRPLAGSSPPGRGRIVSIKDVYQFDPAPQALSEPQRKHILGLQANVWTEHIRTEERFEYMTFPRLAALAEVAWSPPERIDWRSFEQRLPSLLARYDRLGVEYARGSAEAASPDAKRSSHELEPCSEKLLLSLEDDAPVRGERAIFLVDIMNPCWIYRAADLSQITAIAAAVGQVPFNFQIGADLHRIVLRKPRSAAGELDVFLGGCDGDRLASLPIAPAVASHAVTRLPPVPIARHAGKHDLCFMFTQDKVDPLWVIDEVELR